MRISFDLDDTLICLQNGTPQEPRLLWILRVFGFNEPLRQGTIGLMQELKKRGWEIWIYTTSYRNMAMTTLWFRLHGVQIDGMINQRGHAKHIAKLNLDRVPSKMPSAFGIDLHVDDSHGVAEEGVRHQFEVVVVDPSDLGWADKVLTAADQIGKPGPGAHATSDLAT
jgi:hypothetical protein